MQCTREQLNTLFKYFMKIILYIPDQNFLLPWKNGLVRSWDWHDRFQVNSCCPFHTWTIWFFRQCDVPTERVDMHVGVLLKSFYNAIISAWTTKKYILVIFNQISPWFCKINVFYCCESDFFQYVLL